MANMLAEILIPKHKQKKRRLEKRSWMICSRLPSISLRFQWVCFLLLSLEAIQNLYTLWVFESVLSRFKCPKEKRKHQPLQLQTRSRWGILLAPLCKFIIALLFFYFFENILVIAITNIVPIWFRNRGSRDIGKELPVFISGLHYLVCSKSHKEKAL